MTSDAFGLRRVEQIALPATDPERAERFYRSVLGMKHLFTTNGMVFFDCGGVRLMIGRPEAAVERAGSVVYYLVEDLHEAHRILIERGVVFESAPHRIADMGEYELWMAFFRDTEGNLLAITGHIRPGGAR